MTIDISCSEIDVNQIRPFREEDREAVVMMLNHRIPPHRHRSVAEWIRDDARRTGNEVFIRLSYGDPVIAYLEATDLETTPWKVEGICGMELVVAPEHWGKGIGSLLYQRAVAFAQERKLRRIDTWFMDLGPFEPAHAFLQKRGFVELEREKGSSLDLTTFDASRFADVFTKAEQSGVRFLAYADVPNSEENKRKLYELYKRLVFDVPRRDDVPFEFPPFEHWVKNIMERPEWAPEALMLAEVNGNWIGVSQLMFKEGKNIGMTWLTGVLAEYRGRHIATALKLRAFEAARARSCTVITTENHEDNGPMLAVNRKFGFVPDPPYVVYKKVLGEEQAEANQGK